MSAIIEVENLGKQYRLGQAQPYHTLRESLVGLIKSPLRRLKSGSNGDSKSTIWALKDVSFKVNAGEVLGIIGRNGAGKSTLLKLLSRITKPTTGRIILNGRIGSLLEVGTGFHPELSGRENIYLNGAILGMQRAEIRKKFDEIVAFSEIEQFLDTPVKRYSSGMYMRLAFAVAAHLDPEILIVDEVLAVGDAAFQKKCLGKMQEVGRSGRTVLFVSHNMAAIQKLCTRAILLRDGRTVECRGVDDAINRYLGDVKTNEVVISGQAVTRARALQVGDRIEISVDYRVDTPLSTPSLGFVIRDYLGNPICGSNPVIDGVQITSASAKTEGTVTVSLEHPKLLNGIYRVSIWFGDGRNDFFHMNDGLLFEVVNMFNLRQPSAADVGPVHPICHWTFQ